MTSDGIGFLKAYIPPGVFFLSFFFCLILFILGNTIRPGARFRSHPNDFTLAVKAKLTQIKLRCNANDSTYILYDFVIKLR